MASLVKVIKFKRALTPEIIDISLETTVIKISKDDESRKNTTTTCEINIAPVCKNTPTNSIGLNNITSPSRKNLNSYPFFDLDKNMDISQTENDIPDTIQITYKNDINILLIHEVIRKRFSYEKCMLANYQKQIKQNTNLIKFALSINEVRRIEKENNELITKIDDIITCKSWNYYVNKSKKFLWCFVFRPFWLYTQDSTVATHQMLCDSLLVPQRLFAPVAQEY